MLIVLEVLEYIFKERKVKKKKKTIFLCFDFGNGKIEGRTKISGTGNVIKKPFPY